MRLDDNGNLHFGTRVRQMLNLWSTQYGIGVQSATTYFRTGADFCWFRGGAHSDTRSDPGGGFTAMRLDDTKLGPPLNANVVGGPEPPPSATGRGRGRVELRSDRDFAITWAKTFGKGRVFYSSLGHTKESWTDPDVTKMYLEAIKWVLGLTEGSTASHPKTQQ